MPARSRCPILVRHYECDPLGHVNHATYVHYCEVGRLAAMTQVGLPFGAILAQGYTIVVVDMYIQYHAPAFTDEALEVATCITRFHGALMTWQQTITRLADGLLIAAAAVSGAFTRADGRPTRIPASIRQHFEALYMPDETPLVPRQRRHD
ncbi:MAG: acyl-CoA thioesterase [Candidatus Tectimicrobiota bacterium]